MTKIHLIWAYLSLFMLIITVINSTIGYFKKKDFTHKDFRLALFSLILTHTQIIFGVVVYVLGESYLGFKHMKNADLRLLALEHPLMMLIGITLITIGWVKHKKLLQSEQKFKTFAIYYGLGLIFILARIPWKNILG